MPVEPQSSADAMVLVEHRDGISIVTLNRPEKRNAIGHEFRGALIDALTAANAADTRVIIVTGSGGCFSGGGDLSGMTERDATSVRKRMQAAALIPRLLRQSAKPIIAAVEGVAFGAGLSIALGCDQIVASQSARFCAVYVKAGLMPDYGLMYLLPARVGDGVARRMMMTGMVVKAEEALAKGLVDELVPEGMALDAALALADRFLQVAPLPIALIKSAWAEGRANTLEGALALEVDTQPLLFTTEDFEEVLAAFAAKRTPQFKGK